MVGSDWRCGRLQADNAVHALDSVPVSLCNTDLFLWAGFLVLWNHTCSVAFCFLSCVWQWDKTNTPRCCSHWRTPSRWMGNAAAGRMLEKWAKCWRQQELPLLPYQSLLSPFHSCRTRKKQCENHPPSALPRQQVSSNRFSYLPGETCLPGAGLGEWTWRVSDTDEKLVCETDEVCSFIFVLQHSAGFILRECFLYSSVHKREHLEQNTCRTHLTVLHQVHLCLKIILFLFL